MSEVTYTVIQRMRSGYYEDPSSIYEDYDEAFAAYQAAIKTMQNDRSIAKVVMFSSDEEIELSEKSTLE